MPEYLFRNPKNPDEVVSVFQKMREKHVYIKDGVEWERVFTVPNATIDGDFDPFSEEKFLQKTKGAKTVGEMWDMSEEFSKKREEKTGKDPIKEKQLKDYADKRGGKKHFSEISKKDD